MLQIKCFIVYFLVKKFVTLFICRFYQIKKALQNIFEGLFVKSISIINLRLLRLVYRLIL